MAIKVADDVAHYTGLMLCGSVWSCPCCSAKIRAARTAEITAAMTQHIDAGGIALFVTLTVRHGVHQRLLDTFGLVADGWRAMNTGRAGKERRERWGVAGTIRALEVTHGDHGWHPHLHLLVLLDVGRTQDDAEGLGDDVITSWLDTVESRGHARPERFAQRAEVVRDAAGVSKYLAKIQDDDHDRPMPVAMEMTRPDLKVGRRKSRTPFEILRDFRTTGDVADLVRWWEYEEVTRRRHAITWSKGLKARFNLEVLDDQELADADVGGVTVAVIPTSTWFHVIRRREGATRLLEAAEVAGVAGVRQVLAEMGLPFLVGVPAPIDGAPPP